MLRCSQTRRIRSKGRSSNSFHLSQPFAKCISSVPFILYLFFGKGWEKFQRKFPLSRWWVHGTQQVLTLGAGRWKQGLKHWTSPHTLAQPVLNRFRSFCITLPLLQNRQTLKSRDGFYPKFRKSRRSVKILVMRRSINKGSNASTGAQKPAKAWPIGANRTKFIPWPALPVSTFLAVRRATKYWFDAHTMDGGCTCCCTCSTGFNNNPTGRKKTMHTFLFDWWKCIHNPYVSAWLPIPKYLSTNTPLWARCNPFLGVANGCQFADGIPMLLWTNASCHTSGPHHPNSSPAP